MKKKELFQNKGFLIKGIICLSSNDAYELLNSNAILVDVRKEYETNYRLFDVPNVIYLEESKFRENYISLPKEKNLIIADNVGIRCKELCAFLMEKGFANVAALIGGIVDWTGSGLPIEVDENYELAGQCSCKLRTKNPKKRIDEK